jgi:hypothetical protein
VDLKAKIGRKSQNGKWEFGQIDQSGDFSVVSFPSATACWGHGQGNREKNPTFLYHVPQGS